MVSIYPFKGLRSINAEMFTTPPYDVISDEQLEQFRSLEMSAIRIILPEGEDQDKYNNAKKALDDYISKEVLIRSTDEQLFYYRQESLTEDFAQEGYIFAISLQDYEDKNIRIHEFTGKKHLDDRIALIDTIKINTGLVWTIYKKNDTINSLGQAIKKSEPIYSFEKLGYRNIFWATSDPELIKKVQDAFNSQTVYIADGHHRILSAATYRKKMIEKHGNIDAPWQRVMVYCASDHQVRLLAYNRVIRKMAMDNDSFLKLIEQDFNVEPVNDPNGHAPANKHDIALFLNGKGWFKVSPKKTDYPSPYDQLDAVILQNLIFSKHLGVANPRETEVLEFVGGAQCPTPKDQEAFIKKKGYAAFIALYPVAMQDVEAIADKDGVMPPKSTWFDPKLLTGLVFHELE